MNETEVNNLWKAFSVFDADGSNTISAKELAIVMRSLGQEPSPTELKELIKEVDVDRSGSIDFDEFKALMIARDGDRRSRLELAFSVFDKDNSGRITAEEMHGVMSQFELTDSELEEMIKEVDQDGNGSIDFEEFCQLLPDEATNQSNPDSPTFPVNSISPKVTSEPTAPISLEQEQTKATPENTSVESTKSAKISEGGTSTEFNPELTQLKELLAKHPQNEKVRGTSCLQMQIGLFRLIQGAAYRCFRESFSANHETHLRVKNLPYCITDFVPFVQNAIALYKGLGIVESACHPVLDAVVESISEEYARLQARIQNWKTLEKTPEMLAEEQAMLASRSKSANVREKFAAGVEYAITMKKQKLSLQQAWELTHHYLNGVQKRRERLEFGRESGVLSQYVSFVDVYLGRNDIRDAQMRISFPYYIGPAVWRFFHTTAEIVDTKPAEQQRDLIAVFKDFFKLFASMYPCPYCRHHLNAYVVQNKEVDMYPVEYLLLGQDSSGTGFQMSIDNKLSTVTDGSSLRLFFWKLHNTVSSSIARSEEWYHQDEKAFYTTRYWPSLDSELARAKGLKQISISTDRIYRIYGLLRPVARLASVRIELQKLLDEGSTQSLEQACVIAKNHIQELEESVIQGGFLQETYYFDPDIVDRDPAFTPEEEEFGRSGFFIEV